jgi:hypothetical protein
MDRDRSSMVLMGLIPTFDSSLPLVQFIVSHFSCSVSFSISMLFSLPFPLSFGGISLDAQPLIHFPLTHHPVTISLRWSLLMLY